MALSFKRGARLFGWTLLLAGLLMAYQGCSRAGSGFSTWLTGDSAEGRVTGIREIPGNAHARTAHRKASIISFTTADGRAVSFEHPVQGSTPPFALGERVRVHYDADVPQDAVAPSGLALLVFRWGFLAAAGLAVLATGAVVLLLAALPWARARG